MISFVIEKRLRRYRLENYRKIPSKPRARHNVTSSFFAPMDPPLEMHLNFRFVVPPVETRFHFVAVVASRRPGIPGRRGVWFRKNRLGIVAPTLDSGYLNLLTPR